VLQVAAAASLIGLLAWTGHAGAALGAPGNVQLGADVLHLLAAGGWLGALPALALLLHAARRAKDDRLRSAASIATRRFSIIGVLAVGTLLVSGIVNSWFLLSSPRDLVATDYGRLLALKVALFAAMIGIAAVNRFRLTPRLAYAPALHALERNALAETGLGLGVLLFVAALGTLAPPAHDHVHIPSTPVPADAAFVHIHSSEAMADVTIEPGKPGPAQARILVMREDFAVLPVKSVAFLLTPRAPGKVAATKGKGRRMSDGHWQVDGLDIGAAGVWTVTLTIDAGTGTPIVLDAPVVIER
jgi:putative copper resistance protein D